MHYDVTADLSTSKYSELFLDCKCMFVHSLLVKWGHNMKKIQYYSGMKNNTYYHNVADGFRTNFNLIVENR